MTELQLTKFAVCFPVYILSSIPGIFSTIVLSSVPSIYGMIVSLYISYGRNV
jgi:hypothetical protein